MHSELVGEADPAEKLVELCFFTELNPDVILRALHVLVPAECGEWSSGSEEQQELWKRTGLFVGLYVQATQDPDWSLSAVLLWRVKSAAEKDF